VRLGVQFVVRDPRPRAGHRLSDPRLRPDGERVSIVVPYSLGLIESFVIDFKKI
jgi:hypothetical protein